MIGSPRFDPTKIRIFFRITKFIINFAASMNKLIWYSMAVCLLTLCACGPSEADQKRAQRQRQEADRKAYQAAFKVGTLPTLDCLPLFLLRDSVLYDTTRADIRLVGFTAQMDCDTAMTGRSVNACVTDLVRAQRLQRKGVPIRWFASTNAYWNLYASKQLKVDSIGRLSDCNIAMTRYSITDYLTAEVLQRAKLQRPALRAQINDVLVREKMATGGELDAFWFTEPMATKTRLDGNRLLYSSQKSGLHPGAIVLVEGPSDDPQRTMRQQEEFRKAYDRAVALINKNGLVYYSDLIIKYMGVDSKVVMNLPKLSFEPARGPREADLKAFQKGRPQ